jgi:hypothetical protein
MFPVAVKNTRIRPLIRHTIFIGADYTKGGRMVKAYEQTCEGLDRSRPITTAEIAQKVLNAWEEKRNAGFVLGGRGLRTKDVEFLAKNEGTRKVRVLWGLVWDELPEPLSELYKLETYAENWALPPKEGEVIGYIIEHEKAVVGFVWGI